MAGKKKRSPEAIAKQKATLARKKRAKQREIANAPMVLVGHREPAAHLGKRGKPATNGAADNPFPIGITGLRDFIRHEVKAQLPDAVAAEMAKRFGGGS